VTLSTKLEVLGQVSERARELEALPGGPDAALSDHLLHLGWVAGTAPWPHYRAVLVDVLAAGVNALLAGDRHAHRPMPGPGRRRAGGY
jgi:hypothetical protein